jgi:uncharacterized 2Fe-2S/4Fe-4S cluster protein (DUF4445 family)
MAQLDLTTGRTLARHSFLNPQRRFGADVLSRIQAANNGAAEELRKSIADGIWSGLAVLQESCGGAAEIVVACNTVMAHLLLGVSCESLGAAPFKPTYTLKESYAFGEVFSTDHPGTVRIVPWFSAFVGGDIAAGLLHIGSKSPYLLIDLGTNGELARFDGGKLTVTAAAAGPAFEGSGKPGGASKVLDDLASLLRRGLLDETGRVADGAGYTQREIRDLQFAKSAVRSGFEILTDGKNPGVVYLAGGMGQAMNPESAVAVGLLPPDLTVRAAGNASLGGAVRLLLAPMASGTALRSLFGNVTMRNLADHPDFEGLFIKHMSF